MKTLKIGERISQFRREKGLTQLELAQTLGVSNQAVSKWESAQCCPDISLLPDIAALFHISIDELLGAEEKYSFERTYFNLKSFFENTAKDRVFDYAYRLSALLHEAVCTDGYTKEIPWDTNANWALTCSPFKWGFSSYSSPQGCSVFAQNAILFADRESYKPADSAALAGLCLSLGKLKEINTLRVLFALYELAADDGYISTADLADKTGLCKADAERALENLPVSAKVGAGGAMLYQIEGSAMHIPPLLQMIRYQ